MKVFLIFFFLVCPNLANAQISISIDTSIKYQTIEGWGAGGSIFAGCSGYYNLLDTTYTDSLSRVFMDYAIDDLGLTGSRCWEIGPRIDGTGMDNGDCDSIDWSKFQANTFNPWMFKWMVYLNDRILAKGFKPSFYSSPTYPTLATLLKPWVLNHPGERSQQIWANALYLKNTFGIEMNYAVIDNEPQAPFTSAILADDIKAVGPRLLSHGLITKVQFAEGVTPQSNWNLISPVRSDSEMWSTVGRISYHNYGSVDTFYRSNMRVLADSLGISTAQTEMGDPSFDDLYNDLTIANCSYWEIGYSTGNILQSKSGQTQFTPVGKFFRLRQIMHYIKPCFIRIGTTSNDTNIRVLAFKNGGKITTLVENISTTAKTVTLTGLPQGKYGLSQSAGEPFREFGIRTVGSQGTITLDVAPNWNVATLYPYSETNEPHTISKWDSKDGYLIAPASQTTLSVTASDAELDALSYKWSVYSQPTGANATITNPVQASTAVSGLTVSGYYVFKIEVSDGVNTSTRKVYLYRYDSNPPAKLGGAGFRFSAPYGLVFSYVGDTTHANVELPTSSSILQVGIGDLAGSDFSGRGKWSLISAPTGANVKIDTTIYIYVSIRAQVSGMTVPGDYVFRCVVKNPPYPDLSAVIKCTVHPASSAPLITSITAANSIITLPESSTLLTAVTSDPEGDLLRHWWAIKSVPAGAKPVFDHQGKPVSSVGNLMIPGTYTFTLRTFDDLHITTKDISITVKNRNNEVNDFNIKLHDFDILPNPVNDYIYINLPEKLINSNSLNIEIYSSLGLKVIKMEYAEKIDVSKLPNGIYFISLIERNEKITKKFVLFR